jgi:hypothetical protein
MAKCFAGDMAMKLTSDAVGAAECPGNEVQRTIHRT